MTPLPTQKALKYLCLIILSFAINFSCSKDEELLEDAVFSESDVPVEDSVVTVETDSVASEPVTEIVEEVIPEEEVLEELTAKNYELRTTIFPAIHDAHLQGETGYNQEIVRLQENRRVSYLMFDLSQIDSIGGLVNDTNLEFTIDSDDGNGTISVFKGDSNDWSEEELNEAIAPAADSLVGQLSTEFQIGATHEVSLDTALVRPEILTLVLVHEEGNDLAFASKEHPTQKGPALIVSYNAPEDAEAIVVEELELTDLSSTDEETTSSEENPDQGSDATPEDSNETAQPEETAPEETTPEETTPEETTPEETTPEETTPEETTPEETTPEETTPEETTPEETTPEETTPEETTPEETTPEEAGGEEENSGGDQPNNEPDAPENAAPVASASASPTSGTAPLEVSFKGSDSTDDQGITRYVWDFRDGSTSNNVNPTHTFEKSGTLEVRLTVTDAQGESHSDTVTIRISEPEKENEAPVSLPKASIASGEAPLEVQFTGDSSTDDKGITEYSWNFQDGSTADTANPSHTFTEPGEYKVVLGVTDEEGLSNARIVIVTVTGAVNEAPKAVASGTPLTGNAPLEVQFRGADSQDDEGITGYFWDFADGQSTTNTNPSHTFSEPGEYNVKLDVRDKEGLTNSATVKVTVTQAPADNGGGDSGSGGGDSGGGDSGGGDSGGGSGSGDNGNGDGGNNDNPSNGVKASTFGYNSSDATNALKAAINSSHSTIIVDRQSSDWVVGPLYLNRIRNKKIIFEDGVVLRAKRGAFRPEDRLFQLVNSDNVEVQGYGATFAMNKSEYSGQQNHALSIVNSNNITVKGLTLTGAGGDGLYISRHNDGEYNRNIVIDGVNSTGNSRQGVTVLSVDGLQIKNSTFSNTSGESPSAGIDFEPESTADRLVNITVSNCTFRDNHGPGIMFAVSKLNGSTRPLDIKFNGITVSNNSISNPRNIPTEIDFGMSTNYTSNPVKGNVVFDGLRVENSRWGAINTKKTAEAYLVTLKNTVIKNVSQGGTNAAVHIGVLSYANRSNANMGGFSFQNVLIDYNGQAPSLELHGPSNNNWDLKNMSGEIRVRSPRGLRLNDTQNILSRSSANFRIVED